jgi:HlyD family secretion protein
MDIPRPNQAKARLRRRLLVGALAVAAAGALTILLARLKPAAPTVERNLVWVDTVKRGPMIRQVRGLGSLVPEEIRWVAARTEGRVERIILRPGAVVTTDSVILLLSNPNVEQASTAAESQLEAAEAELVSLKVQLERNLLEAEAAAARARSDFEQTRLRAEVNEELFKDGLISPLEMRLSRVTADQASVQHAIEQKRFAFAKDSIAPQLAVKQSEVNRLGAQLKLRQAELEALQVRASMPGVLQQLPVEVGAQVQPGANLARVADPTRLKAEVRIAETQAKDIQIGQVASIDTRNGVVPGRVIRVDPAVQNGTVLVDVALEGALPRGARPDLSIDGTIELERLDDVLYVGRPAFGQEGGSVGIFRLNPSGPYAERTQVRLGRSSVNTVEILQGLQVGDQVILSDMSQWDASDRVKLN